MKYDYIIITHLPSFYKVNLYNKLAQRLRICVIFLGRTSCIRTEDFILEDFQFDAVYLSNGNFEQRNKLQTVARLVKNLKQHSFKKLLVSGWDQIEFWIALLFSKKEKNCLSLESGFESQRYGLKKLLKQIFLAKIHQVFATGLPQIELLKSLHYKGAMLRTLGVGIFHTNHSKMPTSFKRKFIYVGRLAPEKNLPTLIEAFKALPEFNLTIVGYGSYRVPKLPNIHLLGHVPQAQMGKLYTEYDVLILPSLHEPWGLVVEEALAYGLPVIASERVGSKEIIEKYKCGLLFDPNKVESLIECIQFIAKADMYSAYQANTQSNWKQIRDAIQVNAYMEGLWATSCKPSSDAVFSIEQPANTKLTLPIRLGQKAKSTDILSPKTLQLKILLIHNYYKTAYKGGEDVVFEREVEALKNILGEENVFVYTVHNNDVKLWHLPFTIWFNYTHYNNVLKLCRTHNIQLVHVHNFFPALTFAPFLAAKRSGCKVVHTLHNYRFWCLNGSLFYKNAICETCTHKKIALQGIVRGCYRGSKMQSLLTALSFA
ncbi:MAG TPA: glycosyltransferase, partial [Gammaproteobacteria bacterium]|nr:glycosyltransferase [Gammaproteobacteria bacterium]